MIMMSCLWTYPLSLSGYANSRVLSMQGVSVDFPITSAKARYFFPKDKVCADYVAIRVNKVSLRPQQRPPFTMATITPLLRGHYCCQGDKIVAKVTINGIDNKDLISAFFCIFERKCLTVNNKIIKKPKINTFRLQTSSLSNLICYCC